MVPRFARSVTLDIAAQWQDLQWPLRGAAVVHSATGEGTLRGPMPYEFTTTAQVDGPDLAPAAGPMGEAGEWWDVPRGGRKADSPACERAEPA